MDDDKTRRVCLRLERRKSGYQTTAQSNDEKTFFKVESLNGRPLIHSNIGHRDEQTLPPNHFLLGRPTRPLHCNSHQMFFMTVTDTAIVSRVLLILTEFRRCRKNALNITREKDIVLQIDENSLVAVG